MSLRMKLSSRNIVIIMLYGLPCLLHHLPREGLVESRERSSAPPPPRHTECCSLPSETPIPSRCCTFLLGTVDIFIRSCILTKHIRRGGRSTARALPRVYKVRCAGCLPLGLWNIFMLRKSLFSSFCLLFSMYSSFYSYAPGENRNCD